MPHHHRCGSGAPCTGAMTGTARTTAAVAASSSHAHWAGVIHSGQARGDMRFELDEHQPRDRDDGQFGATPHDEPDDEPEPRCAPGETKISHPHPRGRDYGHARPVRPRERPEAERAMISNSSLRAVADERGNRADAEPNVWSPNLCGSVSSPSPSVIARVRTADPCRSSRPRSAADARPRSSTCPDAVPPTPGTHWHRLHARRQSPFRPYGPAQARCMNCTNCVAASVDDLAKRVLDLRVHLRGARLRPVPVVVRPVSARPGRRAVRGRGHVTSFRSVIVCSVARRRARLARWRRWPGPWTWHETPPATLPFCTHGIACRRSTDASVPVPPSEGRPPRRSPRSSPRPRRTRPRASRPTEAGSCYHSCPDGAHRPCPDAVRKHRWSGTCQMPVSMIRSMTAVLLGGSTCCLAHPDE